MGINDRDLFDYINKFDAKYGPTYIVLDALQRLFYTSDAARESFVDLCEEKYVQQVTFDSYLYKTVQGNNPVGTWHCWARPCRHSRRTTCLSLHPCASSCEQDCPLAPPPRHIAVRCCFVWSAAMSELQGQPAA